MEKQVVAFSPPIKLFITYKQVFFGPNTLFKPFLVRQNFNICLHNESGYYPNLYKTRSSKVLRNCKTFLLTNISDSILLNCFSHFGEHGCQLINFDFRHLIIGHMYMYIESRCFKAIMVLLEASGSTYQATGVLVLVDGAWFVGPTCPDSGDLQVGSLCHNLEKIHQSLHKS